MLTKEQERRIIAGLMLGLFCLGVAAWCWFTAPVNSPRFAMGQIWLIVGASIMFVVSQIELHWHRRAWRLD